MNTVIGTLMASYVTRGYTLLVLVELGRGAWSVEVWIQHASKMLGIEYIALVAHHGSVGFWESVGAETKV